MEQNRRVCPSKAFVRENGRRMRGGLSLVNVRKILADLKAERTRLNRAIAAIEKLTPKKKSRRVSGKTQAEVLQAASGEKRGQLLEFRRLKISARAKTSRAEEA
jgi:hypothetical protein